MINNIYYLVARHSHILQFHGSLGRNLADGPHGTLGTLWGLSIHALNTYTSFSFYYSYYHGYSLARYYAHFRPSSWLPYSGNRTLYSIVLLIYFALKQCLFKTPSSCLSWQTPAPFWILLLILILDPIYSSTECMWHFTPQAPLYFCPRVADCWASSPWWSRGRWRCRAHPSRSSSSRSWIWRGSPGPTFAPLLWRLRRPCFWIRCLDSRGLFCSCAWQTTRTLYGLDRCYRASNSFPFSSFCRAFRLWIGFGRIWRACAFCLLFHRQQTLVWGRSRTRVMLPKDRSDSYPCYLLLELYKLLWCYYLNI